MTSSINMLKPLNTNRNNIYYNILDLITSVNQQFMQDAAVSWICTLLHPVLFIDLIQLVLQ